MTLRQARRGASGDNPKNTSHGGKAYAILRSRIRTGELHPGDVISENSTAADMGMSRTPVREAMLRLMHEGLLSVLPNRGFLVATFSVNDVEEMYTIREVLEGLACRLAALRATPAGVKKLEEILATAQRAAGGTDVERLRELDHEFHEELATQSRNRRLRALLANMRDADLLQRYGRHDATELGRYRVSLQEHRAVVETIGRRDPDGAERAMRAHCTSAARFIASYAFGGTPATVDGAGS